MRQGFADRNLGYDAALAAFEGAALLLLEGRTENARSLIEESLPTFVALKIRREGIASIGLYAESLRRDAETSTFAREMLSALDRSGLDAG